MTGTGTDGAARGGACVVKLAGAGKAAPKHETSGDGKGCRRTASVATFPVDKAVEAHVARLEQAVEAGDQEIARKTFRGAMKIAPDSPALLQRWGCALAWRFHRHAEAMRVARRMIPTGTAAAFCTIALVHEAAGRLERARMCYRRALEANLDEATTWFNYGDLLLKMERFADAVAALREARRLDPADPDVAARLAHAYELLGKLEMAEAAAREALAIAPTHVHAVRVLGRVLHQTGRPDESIHLLQSLAGAIPDDAGILYDLTWALLSAGRVSEAAETADRSIALDPRAVHPKLVRARCHVAAGKLDAAGRIVDELLRVNPDSVPTLHEAAHLAAVVNDWKGCAARWRRVLDLTPHDRCALQEYVTACRKSGDAGLLDEARGFLRRRWPDHVHLCEDAPRESPR
jgi:tetratricopeptide (TPR) repeat protein